jgi:hypothetical protein
VILRRNFLDDDRLDPDFPAAELFGADMKFVIPIERAYEGFLER